MNEAIQVLSSQSEQLPHITIVRPYPGQTITAAAMPIQSEQLPIYSDSPGIGLPVAPVQAQHICDGQVGGKPCPWHGHSWNLNSHLQSISIQPRSIFEQIDSLIQKLLSAEFGLDHGYAKLGLLLTEVSEQELWRDKYKSFDTYLEELSDKYHRGRTQLYHYYSSVREMKPYLTESQMNEMGISKLGVLKKATKELGFPPNNDVIEIALDPKKTVSDVRKAVAQNHKLTQEEQTGTWFDLGGFFVTDDEKLVIRSAFEAAWRTDPVIQKTVKEQIRTKEGLLRLCMEFLGTHGEEEA